MERITTFTNPDPNKDVFSLTKLRMAADELRRMQPTRFIVTEHIDKSVHIPEMVQNPQVYFERTYLGETVHCSAEVRQDTVFLTVADALEIEKKYPEHKALLEWRCKRPGEEQTKDAVIG